MALQVWLPLNGNIENQGLNPISMVGSPNSWGNGKIGKCATFSPTSTTPTTKIYNTTTSLNYINEDFSWSVWINPSSTVYGTSYIFTVGRADAGGYGYGMGVSSGSVYCWFGSSNWSISITHNVWTHISFCRKGNTIKLYKNGVLDSTQTFSGTLPTYSDGNGLGLGCFHYSGSIYAYNGSINDFRIYNHCLSPKEVKEISKGLVLHYKMDDPCINKNVSIDPAFNNYNGGTYTYDISTNTYTITSPVTSSSWGAGVHLKDPQITVPWGSSYRCSFEVLVPTAHNIQIDYNNYLSDNTNTGNDNDSGRITTYFSIPANTWTKIVIGATNANSANVGKASLIVYDGIGLQTDKDSASVTWYIRNVKSEITNDPSSYSKNSWSDNIVYDCSGFGYNGTVTSVSTPILDSDSPRYSSAFKFDTTAKYITTAIDPTGYKDTYSIAWWGNIPSFGGAMFWGFGNMMNWYDGKYWNQGDGGNNPFYSSGTTTITPPSINTWHHYVITGDGSATKLYVDGVLYGTAKTYRAIGGISLQINGWPNDANYRISGMKMSDYRIYATPLSAEDVKELYNTSAIVCDNGTVMAYSLEE